MIEHVAAAFDRQDYKTAAQLLKPLIKQHPDDPWVRFYLGRLQEVMGHADVAEATYRKLLRDTSNPKVALQTRQGLQRLEENAQQKRQEAIARAAENPDNTRLGFLILEPVATEAKQEAAKRFAPIMKLDPYTARLHLPSRGWRLYRTGPLAELQVYCDELNAANIPAFQVALDSLQAIRVFRVQHFSATDPQATVVCLNEHDQMGYLPFEWSDVKGRVEGLLPMLENVVDLGAWNKLTHKERTQDYVNILDLHLPKRNCILRFHDRSYQFKQGVDFTAQSDMPGLTHQTTIRQNWNNLVDFVNKKLLPLPVFNDFTVFAETALEHLDFIDNLKSHIDLFRQEDTKWDSAFQLYSGSVFLQKIPDLPSSS